jgi:hypothetical protein
MDSKQKIIERLFNIKYITFEEAMILQKDTVALPRLNVLNNLNDIYQIPGPGTVFNNQDKDDKTI